MIFAYSMPMGRGRGHGFDPLVLTDMRIIDGQALSHARTVVRECCKGDDESQWERGKFDPPPPKNPLTDGHQNLCT